MKWILAIIVVYNTLLEVVLGSEGGALSNSLFEDDEGRTSRTIPNFWSCAFWALLSLSFLFTISKYACWKRISFSCVAPSAVKLTCPWFCLNDSVFLRRKQKHFVVSGILIFHWNQISSSCCCWCCRSGGILLRCSVKSFMPARRFLIQLKSFWLCDFETWWCPFSLLYCFNWLNLSVNNLSFFSTAKTSGRSAGAWAAGLLGGGAGSCGRGMLLPEVEGRLLRGSGFRWIGMLVGDDMMLEYFQYFLWSFRRKDPSIETLAVLEFGLIDAVALGIFSMFDANPCSI